MEESESVELAKQFEVPSCDRDSDDSSKCTPTPEADSFLAEDSDCALWWLGAFGKEILGKK